jgi:aspartyl protease family protein
MAMGFMRILSMRSAADFSAVAVVLGFCGISGAHAVDVGVVGLFPGKAVVVIDGGDPRTLAVGAKTVEGVRLLSVDSDSATLEIDGKRRNIAIGQQVFSASHDPGASTAGVTLNADANGHFMTMGTVNGAAMRFIVDTGATLVALGASDARRANVNAADGEAGSIMTANGVARAWRVKLNSLRIGGIVLRDVDATVLDQDMPFALLGQSFLNRMEMRRSGDTMSLRKRY